MRNHSAQLSAGAIGMSKTVATGLAMLVVAGHTALTAGISTSPASQPSRISEIVAGYRAGNFVGAASLFDDLGVNGLSVDVDAITSGSADPWYAATLAMVIAEAGMNTGTLGTADASAPVYRLEPRSKLAWDLVPKLEDYAARSHLNSVVDFCRKWWLWVASWRSRTNPLTLAFPLNADTRFKNDPDLLVQTASFHQQLMGPIRRGGSLESPIPESMIEYAMGTRAPPGIFIESAHGRFWADSVRDAEVALRRAIALSPNLAEAHLRLGYVLYQEGRHKDAQSELVRAQSASATNSDPWTGAIAGMLLGRLLEGNRQSEMAAEAYRQDADLHVPGPSPILALGGFLVRQGLADQGWTTVQQALMAPADHLDPWTAYPSGAFRRHDELLETLRNYVRVKPNTSSPSTAARQVAAALVTGNAATNAVTPPLPQREFATQTDEVRLDIRVTGSDGPVGGLTAEDFEIRDNGVVQKPILRQVTPNLNVVLVLDRSASMHRSIATAIDAGSILSSSLRSDDEMSVVQFSDRIDLLPFQHSTRQLLPAIAPASLSRSVLRDAVLSGASLVAGASQRAWVVALTDGGDNASWTERGELVEVLMHSSVVLDCVLVEPDWKARGDIAYGDFAVEGLTKPTGGVVLDASGDVALGSMLRKRIAEIRSSYVVTFVPTGVKQGDGFHKLTVKIKGGSDAGTIQTKAGYYSTVLRGR